MRLASFLADFSATWKRQHQATGLSQLSLQPRGRQARRLLNPSTPDSQPSLAPALNRELTISSKTHMGTRSSNWSECLRTFWPAMRAMAEPLWSAWFWSQGSCHCALAANPLLHPKRWLDFCANQDGTERKGHLEHAFSADAASSQPRPLSHLHRLIVTPPLHLTTHQFPEPMIATLSRAIVVMCRETDERRFGAEVLTDAKARDM